MKIALGTTSDAKIKYLKDVLKELQVLHKIEPIEVGSNISDQPLSSKETKKGSINRARNAIKKSNLADFGLGIEIGYHPDKNGNYEMFCWASIVDKTGKILSAQSHKVKLPVFHQEILKNNKSLGDFVGQFILDNPNPVSQHIGIIIRDRQPFIYTAVKTVLIYYLQE